FMPSSQRRFAVDFDADDRIDLRHSVSDAIGSVGRYLQQHGWQTGGPVAVPARVESGTSVATGIKPEMTLQELAKQGVLATGDPQQRAALYVITRYNRSSFYAMSVFQLAEALRVARASQ
ncbi:lytic murein transglycosylase, partial [bacterium]|nr:lytic murein transglycosylase [bacterium]